METMTSIEEDLREAEEAAKVMIKGMGHHGAYFHAYSHPAKDLGECCRRTIDQHARR